MDNVPIALMLKITASPWRRADDNADKVRMWQSPPFKKNNTAARVVKSGIWPFTRYDWAVWSPFADEDAGENGEDAVLDGSASEEEAAMVAADAALRGLIAEAEKAVARP